MLTTWWKPLYIWNNELGTIRKSYFFCFSLFISFFLVFAQRWRQVSQAPRRNNIYDGPFFFLYIEEEEESRDLPIFFFPLYTHTHRGPGWSRPIKCDKFSRPRLSSSSFSNFNSKKMGKKRRKQNAQHRQCGKVTIRFSWVCSCVNLLIDCPVSLSKFFFFFFFLLRHNFSSFFLFFSSERISKEGKKIRVIY